MKNIVLIGASGFVGTALLKEALSRGNRVKAIVRHPEKITLEDPDLKIEKGDASDPAALSELCKGSDVVISAYNPGWKNPNIAQETLRVYPLILEGVKRSGVKRFLVVGGAGSLFVAPGVRLMDSGSMPEAYLPPIKALASFYLDILRFEKEIDWVFFCPAGEIFPGARTGQFRLGKDDLITGPDGKSRISVEDFAVAMIDEAENPVRHIERFTIGY
ncbi:MAG: NAD(P)-dependent oxidoreductase [Bacteroidales bacterium]